MASNCIYNLIMYFYIYNGIKYLCFPKDSQTTVASLSKSALFSLTVSLQAPVQEI